MVAYGALITSFEQAIVDATSGAKLAVAKKNTLHIEVLAKTKALGQYVNSIAEGDLDMLVSSGFTLGKQPQPRTIGNPVNLQILQELAPGSLICRVDAVKGAFTYGHMITPHPLTSTSIWTTVISTRSKNTFEGLEQGKMYWYKVVAVGSNDQKTYSEEASQYVNFRTITKAA